MFQFIAQITNPALDENLGDISVSGDSGAMLATLIVLVWNTILTLGGMAVIIYFVRGALRWLSAGGDPQKVELARNTITNALIGMALLFSSIAFANYIGPAIGFDLLALEFLTPDSVGSGP